MHDLSGVASVTLSTWVRLSLFVCISHSKVRYYHCCLDNSVLVVTAARTKQLKRYSSSEPSTDAAEGLDNNVEQTKSMLPSHFSVEPLDPKPRTGDPWK